MNHEKHLGKLKQQVETLSLSHKRLLLPGDPTWTVKKDTADCSINTAGSLGNTKTVTCF